MSISSVSSGTTAAYTPINQQKDVRNAFKQVADAINDNDLQGAQNAFDSLAQLLGNNQQSSTTSSGTSQTSSNGTDFSSLVNQIGSALQSGDLDQAKQALQNLQQTAQSGRPHHHHHHGGGGGGVAATQSTQSTDPTSASTDASSDSGVNLTV